MDNYFTDIIGKGMTFPIKLNRNENGETGWYPVNGDMELVRNNINSILYYMIGHRLWECIEEPNSQALSFIIKEFIKTAIGTWEQRLTFKGIKVARVDAKVNIEVEYSINGTGSSQYLYLTYNNLDNSLNTK